MPTFYETFKSFVETNVNFMNRGQDWVCLKGKCILNKLRNRNNSELMNVGGTNSKLYLKKNLDIVFVVYYKSPNICLTFPS